MSRSTTNVRRSLAAAVLAVVATALGVAASDLLARRSLMRAIGGDGPNGQATVSIENRFIDESGIHGFRQRHPDWALPFDRVTSISLSGARIDDHRVAAIADAMEGVSGIDRLSLSNTRVTDAGVARLARLSSVAALELRYYGFAPEPDVRVTEGVGAILAAGHFRELTFVGVSLGDDGARALANSRSLRKLEIINGRLTSEGLDSLAGCETLTHFKVENSGAPYLSRESAWAFRQARPEMFFRGPDVPATVTKDELNAFRRQRDRIRRERRLVE